jgi:hypothetical protein
MTRVRLNPPVHWESWCSWLLAIWLCISPGLLKFATYAAVLTGFVLICTEIVTISTFRFVGGMDQRIYWLLADHRAMDPSFHQFIGND